MHFTYTRKQRPIKYDNAVARPNKCAAHCSDMRGLNCGSKKDLDL